MTVVTHNNDGTTSEIDRAPSRTSDAVTMHRFDVPVGGTTIARSIVLTVISEDEEEREIEISINRDDTPTTPATLTGLTLSGVTLAFASGTTEYTASVANAVDKDHRHGDRSHRRNGRNHTGGRRSEHSRPSSQSR